VHVERRRVAAAAARAHPGTYAPHGITARASPHDRDTVGGGARDQKLLGLSLSATTTIAMHQTPD